MDNPRMREQARTVAWRCPTGHVLGQVQRSGSKVQRMLLYRVAISDQQESGVDEVEVMAVLEGLVMDVRCSICGGIRTWRPGAEKTKPQITQIYTEGRAI
jgi:hypothetical protein